MITSLSSSSFFSTYLDSSLNLHEGVQDILQPLQVEYIETQAQASRQAEGLGMRLMPRPPDRRKVWV